jgi:hypothetical protein
MHFDGTRWVSNTLSDLTKREYRAARDFDPADVDSTFPHLIEENRLSRDEDYLVLDSALAFDVRLYDPGAPLYSANGNVFQPGDPGWYIEAVKPLASRIVAGYGAYCDLGWAWDLETASVLYDPALPLPTGVPAPQFNTRRQAGWHPKLTNFALALREYPCVYDTWSFHCENDGIDQETVLENFYSEVLPPAEPKPQFAAWQKSTLDQGTNGLDDDNEYGVDDPGERETAPPYDFPLRGVKVSLRIYEGDARQIRETSVTHSFAP